MYDFLMQQRRDYGDGSYKRHRRYKGIPWEGEDHDITTWPDVFDWNDGVAAIAQAEADRLAGGGSPQGVIAKATGDQLYLNAPISADYMCTTKEVPGQVLGFSYQCGGARMAMHYHDFGGDGPVFTKIGIGAADAGGGATWWVVRYGE
ncbi:MAG: hypothetical protein E3J72_05750 [Planctomycetota bacterium]|nr:MAG: hypothetical protein E3J72_05750 [Planctomycetota bacterium]